MIADLTPYTANRACQARGSNLVPPLELGGLNASLRRELLPLRSLDESRADIPPVEKEAEGLLKGLLARRSLQ